MLGRLRQALQRVFTSTITGLRARNADEQIKASWAEWIKSYDEVPDLFKSFFEPFQLRKREFPYTVLTPTFEGFIQRTTEKIISDFEDKIYVLERNEDSFEIHCYPLDSIYCVQVRTMLLDSRITIYGINQQGAPVSSSFRFNSITDYLFKPILARIRLGTANSKTPASISELEKFDAWRKVNFKFMNYAKRSLLAGEHVLFTILQPEIRETVVKILGRTYERFVSPTLACILTDREVIMIREEKRGRGEDKYGGIWDFLLSEKIERLSLDREEDSLMVLSIHFAGGDCREYLFQTSAEKDLMRLQGLLSRGSSM